MIAAITAGGRYQIVEKLELPQRYHAPDGTPIMIGVYVDVETTGLDADAKVIQLVILRFEFSKDGRIFALCPCESWLEDPRIPIPPAITELTRITDGDVAGQRINDARVGDRRRRD